MAAVLNAANEVAAEAFINRKISYTGIAEMVRAVMKEHTLIGAPDLDQILAADQWARTRAAEITA